MMTMWCVVPRGVHGVWSAGGGWVEARETVLSREDCWPWRIEKPLVSSEAAAAHGLRLLGCCYVREERWAGEAQTPFS